MESLGKLEAVSKVVALLATGASALGALLQYHSNSEAEARMRALAVLETDVKVSNLFAGLIQTANGYGKWNSPDEKVIEAILSDLPPGVLDQLLRADPRALGGLFVGSVIPEPVPLSAQLAAAESISNLALKYEFLKEPAIAGLRVVSDYTLPEVKKPLERLCNYYEHPVECELPAPNREGISIPLKKFPGAPAAQK